jgi:hypothetical protein
MYAMYAMHPMKTHEDFAINRAFDVVLYGKTPCISSNVKQR